MKCNTYFNKLILNAGKKWEHQKMEKEVNGKTGKRENQ